MKQFLLGLATSGLFAFTVSNYVVKINTAEVNQMQGVYIFQESKPAKEYQYLGTIKLPAVVWSTKYAALRDLIVKKVKQEYPSANGVIITADAMDKADAILIKE